MRDHDGDLDYNHHSDRHDDDYLNKQKSSTLQDHDCGDLDHNRDIKHDKKETEELQDSIFTGNLISTDIENESFVMKMEHSS